MAEAVEEQDVREWADAYIAEQRHAMSAAGGRRRRQTREEVTAAVKAKFGEDSGRVGGVLTWIRILYWVAVILAAL